jgi:hypothetical protein
MAPTGLANKSVNPDLSKRRFAPLAQADYVQRYASMKHLIRASVAIALVASGARAQEKWPSDLARFIERRDGCDHFRGEEPYDKERRAFLNQKMNELCPGTDKALAGLKEKYRKNKKAMAVLNEYESQIEPSASTK